MIELENVITAVNTILEEKFPLIGITSTDIEEGYKPPCFYTEWDGNDSTHIGEDMSDDSFIARILYFPADRYKNKVELVDMQKSLKEAFGNVLKVNDDFFIPIDQLSFRTTADKVLVLEIELKYVQFIPEEDGELIEELEFNIKEGEQ